MNIAIFSPSQNPYSETFIQAHKRYLKGDIYYYYGTGTGIKLEHKYSNNAPKITLVSKLTRKLLKQPYYTLWAKAVLKSLKSNKIQAVLIEYGTHAYHLLPVLKKLNMPIVVHFHGYDASIKQVIASCDFYNEVFDRAKKVIVVSKKMKQMLIEIGCPNNKIVYTPCAPNDGFFKVETTFQKNQFISIGRFVDKKAPYLTILSFKKVIEKHPKTKLLMAGDGVLLNTCKNLVRQYSLEDNIEFLGVISSKEYQKLLAESLAFVQHSIMAKNGDMEGTPVSVLEASAAGLPVISTNHAGIPDVIINNKTGLLCEEHDVNAMSDNMFKLIENPKLAKEMGATGKKHIQQNFCMENHIRLIQEALSL